MRTENLEYFMEAIKTGSFNKAASNLNTTHQSISTAITNLENEMGATLVIRDKSGCSLTPAGEIMMDYACNLLEISNECKQTIATSVDNIRRKGQLSVLFAPYVTTYVPPTFYSLFLKSYPGISLHFREDDKLSIIDQINHNESDIGVFLASEEELEKYKLKKLIPHPHKFYAIVAPDHPLASKKSVSVSTIQKYPIALYQNDDIIGAIKMFLDRSIKSGTFDIYLATNIVSSYYSCIGTGKVVGFLAKRTDYKYISQYGIADSLAWIPIKQAKELYLCYVIAPNLPKSKNELVEIFLNEIQSSL